jgi:hypothetical protein
MKNTRFERLTKKDRDFITSYVATHPEVNSDISSLLQQSNICLHRNIAGLHSRTYHPDYAYNSDTALFASELGILAGQIIQRGIAKRLIKDSPKVLVDSMFIASRLLYVANLAKTSAYSGTDCQHIFDLIHSVATNDSEVIKAYLKRYDYEAKQGHPFTKLLCNAVTMILKNHLNDDIIAELHKRRETAYDKAILMALAGIAKGNSQQVSDNLLVMITGHRRKTFNSAMLRYFAVPVHAVFNMTLSHFNANGLPLPSAPEMPLWDSAVHSILQEPTSIECLELIGILSPQAAKWAKDLPESLPAEAFEELFQK